MSGSNARRVITNETAKAINKAQRRVETARARTVALEGYLATILRTAKNPGSPGATLEKIAQLAEEALGPAKELAPWSLPPRGTFECAIPATYAWANGGRDQVTIRGWYRSGEGFLHVADSDGRVFTASPDHLFAPEPWRDPLHGVDTLPPPEPYQETRIPIVHIRCHVCGGAHDGFAPEGCPNDHGPDSFGGSDYP